MIDLSPPLLEVIVCSVEDARAAERGGAGRLEIISHFEVGGLTPPLELVAEIMSAVKIPVRVMIRECEDFFSHDEKIIERLCESSRSFAELCVDGLVLGFLIKESGQTGIDHDLLAHVLSYAPNQKATFHRAFELLPDPLRAIEGLKRHPQIDRVLTSGGDGHWPKKVERLVEWQSAARPEIEILAGGGIDAGTIGLLRRTAEIREFHVGRAAREGGSIEGGVKGDRVQALVESIKS